MKFYFFTLLMFTLLTKVSAQYLPVKQDSLTLEKYNKHIENLNKIYDKIKYSVNNNSLSNAYVNKGSILSMLGAPKDSVFQQVIYAFKFDSLTTCRLLRHFHQYGSYGFRDYCLKYDSVKWNDWCRTCNSYSQKKMERNDGLNNSLIDSNLVKQLVEIYDDDQQYRKNDLFSTHKKQQGVLDSINLIKIDSIIQKRGYPGRKIAGNHSMTAFYVIQHGNLATREKYLPLIMAAVKEKDLAKTALTFILDRIYLDKYNTQLWGTQSIWDVSLNKYVPAPIDNSEEAIKLRKEIDAIE
jgi:hypothetical protein